MLLTGLLAAGRRELRSSSDDTVAIFLGVVTFSLYFFSYWWNVTMFMLPNSPDGGLFGTDLLTTVGLAQMLGYGISKIPATKVVAMVESGPGRDKLLAILLVGGYLPMALSIALLPPWGVALGIFIASLPASWAWGVLCLYVEGRQATEALVAGMSSVCATVDLLTQLQLVTSIRNRSFPFGD